MPITGTNEPKNSALTANLEEKVGAEITLADATGTWQENEGTWDNPETTATLEAKNTAITASLESKN